MRFTCEDSRIKDIRIIYKKHGSDAMLLELQHNASWLFGGRDFVPLCGIKGVADVLVTDSKVYMLTSNIEIDRLRLEEFGDPDIDIIQYMWYDNKAKARIINEITGGSFVTDGMCEQELMKIRSILSMSQISMYEALCIQTAKIMEEACFEVKKGMTEYEVSAILAGKSFERGLEPIILLVGADERLFKYRHPLPTSHIVENYVMLVLGARKNGLYSNITRFVSFGSPSDKVKKAQNAVLNLEAMLISKTRPGVSCGELFEMLVKGYKNEGVSDEWELHHQGGLTGYQPRECKVTTDCSLVVEPHQVYAWNPSVTGYKAEDVILVEEERNRILTVTPNLPMRSVKYDGEIYQRPDILIR